MDFSPPKDEMIYNINRNVKIDAGTSCSSINIDKYIISKLKRKNYSTNTSIDNSSINQYNNINISNQSVAFNFSNKQIQDSISKSSQPSIIKDKELGLQYVSDKNKISKKLLEINVLNRIKLNQNNSRMNIDTPNAKAHLDGFLNKYSRNDSEGDKFNKIKKLEKFIRGEKLVKIENIIDIKKKLLNHANSFKDLKQAYKFKQANKSRDLNIGSIYIHA